MAEEIKNETELAEEVSVENKKRKIPLFEYTQKNLRRLVICAIVMIFWILIWALVFKFCYPQMLIRNYTNMRDMTMMERIIWDLIPFNYRGTDYWIVRQIIDTALNCFVFVPFGIALNYVFKKHNALRDVAICFGLSVFIELLQLITVLGNPSTEDLITNVFGYFIGLGIYSLWLKSISLKAKVRLFAAINIICIPIVIFSLVTFVSSAPLIYGIISKTL